MNEQHVLNIYKIAIEKKLKKYSECNCCEKHKKDRPTRWDPMIELPFKGTQDRACSCPCRHNARLLCCYHPDCKIERAKDSNLGHYVDDILDEDQQEELHEYFIDSESEDILVALDEFEGDYDEEELRIYRIKFLNDVSN